MLNFIIKISICLTLKRWNMRGRRHIHRHRKSARIMRERFDVRRMTRKKKMQQWSCTLRQKGGGEAKEVGSVLIFKFASCGKTRSAERTLLLLLTARFHPNIHQRLAYERPETGETNRNFSIVVRPVRIQLRATLRKWSRAYIKRKYKCNQHRKISTLRHLLNYAVRCALASNRIMWICGITSGEI